MEAKIREVVHKALAELGAGSVSFVVERPSDMAHGDFAVNAALVAAKGLGKNPREVAEHIVAALRKAFEAVGDTAKIEIAGPGFVNITLSPECVHEAVQTLKTESNTLLGKRVMVEYTDPNPFKEMHIGHMMSNTIGESVSRLVGNAGATLVRANYQGDVGPHVAKAIWGMQKAGIVDPKTAAEIGKAYAEGAAAYEADESAKAEIDAINKSIYQKDSAAIMDLWEKGRRVSLDAFEEVYRTLGTKFDFYFFESETAAPGMEMIREGLASGVFDESEGAVIYQGEKKGLHTLVFVTSKGTPTYETKDLGLAKMKEDAWPSDLSIILTANEQIGHFKVMFAALEDLRPELAKKTVHIPHGFLRLTTGKMASRTGNVITAESLIAAVTEQALAKNEDRQIASQVALAAIKYAILKQSSGSDIIFDMEKSLSLEGDSGPYLQYALVRARKILAATPGVSGTEAPAEPYAIERVLIHYPAVVERALAEYSPHYVAQYLTELASSWNSFYANEQILGSDAEAYKIRVAQTFERVMSHGLTLLGIPTPERL